MERLCIFQIWPSTFYPRIFTFSGQISTFWKTYCLQFPVHCPRSICGFPSTISSLFKISILCFGSRSILAMNFFIFWKLMRNECFWQGRLQTGYLSGDGRWNLNLLRRLNWSEWFSEYRCSRIWKIKIENCYFRSFFVYLVEIFKNIDLVQKLKRLFSGTPNVFFGIFTQHFEKILSCRFFQILILNRFFRIFF